MMILKDKESELNLWFSLIFNGHNYMVFASSEKMLGVLGTQWGRWSARTASPGTRSGLLLFWTPSSTCECEHDGRCSGGPTLWRCTRIMLQLARQFIWNLTMSFPSSMPARRSRVFSLTVSFSFPSLTLSASTGLVIQVIFSYSSVICSVAVVLTFSHSPLCCLHSSVTLLLEPHALLPPLAQW